ncbi:formimidoylglutamase [Fervidicella metallireducens AeB]|uniref:Formimidoylglutamase n=1 Tax=Fervidicella metallireducens AeB TaxID=1403537 RepID=A0A017RSV6_9CLOT|nr:formimidoylglutamase [Fervidicella metallireducens]EYE87843.1 formimidoylglutamase [Fervidicella metallireducens AeB]
MFNKNYRAINDSTWYGRIDSLDNYDAFRWHQWVKPLDLRDENLIPLKDKLGFAFLGFCCDEGVRRNKGRTGAANGPQSIRKEMANLPCDFTKDVLLFDAGDILSENISLEESQTLLAAAVEKILSLNLFPIILGGGHETAFGNYSGILNYLAKKTDKPKIGIINFDAHFDLRPYPEGGNSGTMFRQIADICKEKNLDYSYFCIGIQKHSNTVDLFKTADRLGVNYILAKDIIDSDNWSVLEKLDDFIKLQDHIYVTICTDVFSTSYAPGVSATQPLGLDPERVLKFLKHILRSNKTVSFDICEVSPRFDLDSTTADLASLIIFSLVNTVAHINNLGL